MYIQIITKNTGHQACINILKQYNKFMLIFLQAQF